MIPLAVRRIYPGRVEPVKIGLIVEAPAIGAGGGGLEDLVCAEDEGFDAVWFRESGNALGGALQWMAALADSTERMRVGIAAPPPVMLHPLRLAEDLAMLDIVSEGRLDWIPIAHAAAHLEYLEIVLQAFRGEPFAHSGEYYSFPELVCQPHPEQAPHPPLWLSGGATPPRAADAARIGAWVDDRIGLTRVDTGRSLAILCGLSISADGSVSSGLRANSILSTGSTGSGLSRGESFWLDGDSARCRDTLAAWVEEAAPAWLFVAPDTDHDDASRALVRRRLFMKEVVGR